MLEKEKECQQEKRVKKYRKLRTKKKGIMVKEKREKKPRRVKNRIN